jgi:hypothetical protein
VTRMCDEIRQDLHVVMREMAAQKKAPPASSKPTAMYVVRDDEGKISGASFH